MRHYSVEEATRALRSYEWHADEADVLLVADALLERTGTV